MSVLSGDNFGSVHQFRSPDDGQFYPSGLRPVVTRVSSPLLAVFDVVQGDAPVDEQQIGKQSGRQRGLNAVKIPFDIHVAQTGFGVAII